MVKAPVVRRAMPMAQIKALMAGKCKSRVDRFSLSITPIFTFAADLPAH
jgi:hypothetical protein